MKLGVGIKIGTSLTLTPQLQQAIRMLQLSNIELEQAVEQELNSNPLLERDLSDSEPFETEAMQAVAASPTASQANNAEPLNDVQQGLDTDFADTHIKDDLAIDTKWDDVYIHEPTKWDKAATTETDYQGQTTDSIQTHLQWQMNLARLSPIDQLICQRLIDSIDDTGFLGISLEELQENLSLEIAFSGINYDLEITEIEVVLKRLQQCEPIGIAARNLAESLQLQLQAFHSNDSFFNGAMALLDNHELLVKNDLKTLMKTTKLDMEAIQQSILLIRELNPFPAQEFSQSDTSYNTPDVLVHKIDGIWQVRLNPDTLPKLKVNNSYANMFKSKSDRKDPRKDETREFIKTNLQNAKHFIRSLDERHSSLLKVATAIVEKQHAFFEQGATALKPLILREIADMVDLHESTVSRITTNKYMLTDNGMFELKYFFSSSVGDAGEEHSSTAISALIKAHIADEDPKKPLSDSKITKLLATQGIEVARRTVAKYRESMGYPSSTERKRLF